MVCCFCRYALLHLSIDLEGTGDFEAEILESIPVLVNELAKYQGMPSSANSAKTVLLQLIKECECICYFT
jgi:hypothetical protein